MLQLLTNDEIIQCSQMIFDINECMMKIINEKHDHLFSSIINTNYIKCTQYMIIYIYIYIYIYTEMYIKMYINNF